MRLRYTLSDRQIRCFASVPVLSLVVTKHCTDDTRVVTDECIEGIDASHSRYADLINNVANGGAVLSVCQFSRTGVAVVGIIGKAVGGEVAVTAGTLLVALAARTERSGRWQVAVDTATACTHLVTATGLASADATRLCELSIQFYIS